MATKKGNQVAISGYLEPQVAADLEKLCAYTRIPKTEYLREAVSDLLKKYARELRKAKA